MERSIYQDINGNMGRVSSRRQRPRRYAVIVNGQQITTIGVRGGKEKAQQAACDVVHKMLRNMGLAGSLDSIVNSITVRHISVRFAEPVDKV